MDRKPSKSQTTQHRKVQRLSRELKKDGYSVRAEVRGYQKPHPMGKSKARPDIVAKKSGHTRIIEVKTPTSIKKDAEQLKTFIRSAAHRSRTTFDIVVTKPRISKKKSSRR